MEFLLKVDTAKLTKLANFLDTVPADRFDLSKWQAQEYKPATKFLGIIPRNNECGFAGCAMGWAAHAKLFDGFALKQMGDGRAFPIYQGMTDFEAAAAVFNMTTNIAYYFFSREEYQTLDQMSNEDYDWYDDETFYVSSAQVSSRIRRFVKKVEAYKSRAKAKKIVEQMLIDIQLLPSKPVFAKS